MNKQGSTVIRAEAKLFSELFRLGRFDVPWHQRYYDWRPSDVEALLRDINDAIEEKRDCYFLGAIVLVEVNDNTGRWKINDGQQRMITISLIIAACCQRFAVENSGSLREGHALRMLFDLDENSTLPLLEMEQCSARITPPNNDKMRYKQMLLGNTIGTNGNLTAAWKKIDEFLSRMNPTKLEQFFDFILQKLEVASLWVPPVLIQMPCTKRSIVEASNSTI